MLKVAVIGALGKMGAEVVRAVSEDPALELAAAIDPLMTGEYPIPGIVTGRDVRCIEGRGIEVGVDFTDAASSVTSTLWALENGIHMVIGTTGIGADGLSRIERAAGQGVANALIAPNFALGAVLMMKFAREAAAVFDQCEVVELHHREKKDAPSGTAIMTAEQVARVMRASNVPGAEEQRVTGSRGGEVGPVRIHSVRLNGFVARQEVIFGSTGQTLTVTHDTTDRSCFMPGVLMAVKAVSGLPGLTIGLEALLPG